MTGHDLRAATPADYDAIVAVVDDWWGRPMVAGLSRLFLNHFHRTSLIAEDDKGTLVGFLVGFFSGSQPDEAYIHYVAVRPDARQSGLARTMYERFFELAHEDGRPTVKAITGPVNERSIAFHRQLGFTVSEPVRDYDGPGNDRVLFTRTV